MAHGVDAAVLKLMQQLNADAGYPYRYNSVFGALITIPSLYFDCVFLHTPNQACRYKINC